MARKKSKSRTTNIGSQKDLFNQIETERNAQGFSIRELSRRAGFSKTIWIFYRKRQREYKWDTLFSAAKAVGLEVYIYTD